MTPVFGSSLVIFVALGTSCTFHESKAASKERDYDFADVKQHVRLSSDEEDNSTCASRDLDTIGLQRLVLSQDKPCEKESEGTVCRDPDERRCPAEIREKAHTRCDNLFSQVRRAFGVPELHKIMGDIYEQDPNFDLINGGSAGSGKSGADFLMSPDGNYFFKTMSNRDFDALQGMAKSYVAHMVNTKAKTLLIRYYGIIKVHGGKRWVIFNNWTPMKFDYKFDLKGSTRDRLSKPSASVQKDVNFDKLGMRILVPTKQIDEILDTMMKDTQLLDNANVLDYSLLLSQKEFQLPRCHNSLHRASGLLQISHSSSGIPECKSPVCDPKMNMDDDPGANGKPTMLCVDVADSTDHPDQWKGVRNFFCDDKGLFFDNNLQPHQYHNCIPSIRVPKKGEAIVKVAMSCFGIIDVLKPYDMKSKFERVWKGMQFWKKDNASIKPPDKYKERFNGFMKKAFNGGSAREFGRFMIPRKLHADMCKEWGTEQSRLTGGGDEFPGFDGFKDYDPNHDDLEDLYDKPSAQANATAATSGGSWSGVLWFLLIVCVALVLGGIAFKVLSGGGQKACASCNGSGWDQHGQPCGCQQQQQQPQYQQQAGYGAAQPPSANCQWCNNSGLDYNSGNPCKCEAGCALQQQQQPPRDLRPQRDAGMQGYGDPTEGMPMSNSQAQFLERQRQEQGGAGAPPQAPGYGAAPQNGAAW